MSNTNTAWKPLRNFMKINTRNINKCVQSNIKKFHDKNNLTYTISIHVHFYTYTSNFTRQKLRGQKKLIMINKSSLLHDLPSLVCFQTINVFFNVWQKQFGGMTNVANLTDISCQETLNILQLVQIAPNLLQCFASLTINWWLNTSFLCI